MPRRARGAPAEHPVTVMISRRVTDGFEVDFEDWASSLSKAASSFPGFLGAGLLRPGRAGQPWHVVYRFDSPGSLEAWERSVERSTVLTDGRHLVAETVVRRVSGLETWFARPGQRGSAPPRWKMFLVSGACIFLLQFLIYTILGASVLNWPLALRLVVVVTVVTASMTWAVMPALARLLSGWLYAENPTTE